MVLARASYASRRLRRTVAEWCADASGLSADGAAEIPCVVWAEQNLPRPTLPYISLRRLTSTSDYTQTRTVADLPLVSSVQVTTTTVGEAARIVLGHGTPGYPVQVGDAIEDVRDGLIAAIAARPDAVTMAVTGPDTFTIAGLGPGLAWPIAVVEGCTVTPVTVGDVEVTEATRTTIVRVDLFGFTAPDETALDYADTLIADLGRAQTAAFFSERGVSMIGARPSMTDISALSGAERETRAFFDLQVAQWTRHTDADTATLAEVADPQTLAIPAGGNSADVDLLRLTA